MIRKKNGQIEWLEFEILAEHKNIVHGVFLRHGGISTDTFSSLNMTTGWGDHPDNVEENRKRISQLLNLQQLIASQCIHEDQISWITKEKQETANCDGLMTTCKGWGLLTTHADCQAALFYDPINKAIASVHAGWRGQVKNIYKATVLKMQKAFGTKPENLLVAISPSLGPKNSEFINFRTELPEEFWPFQIKPTYFDLWTIARYQLENCGLLPHHIQIACMDTFADDQNFYSFRRARKAGIKEKFTGTHASVIALTPSRSPK